MPMFPPNLTEALNSLQRQIDQINTSRPGPMSWGPDDGHLRIYKANGTDVWFEADSSGGARVDFRGELTGLTSHLEGQDTRITTDRADRIAVDLQLDGRITTERTDRIAVDQSLSGQIASERTDRIAVDQSLSGRITTAQSTANNAASAASTAQSRADSAYSRAGSAISDAADAMSRANSAYDLASGGASNNDVGLLRQEIDNLKVRIARLENAGPG